MKYRVDYVRRVDPATRAGQPGMRWSIEVVARSEAEAIEIANREAARIGKDKPYKISNVRKI